MSPGLHAAAGEAGELVLVHGIAHGGEGVGRAAAGDGRVWLVEGALPEEQVLAQRTEERRRMLRGRTLAVVAASRDRATPPCPVADACGGCGLQHVRAAAQAELKRQIAEGQLRGLGIAVSEVVPSPAALGYRRRARLHYERVSGGLRLGLLRRHSHEVLDLADCPVLDAPLRRALARARLLAPALPQRGELHLLSDGAAAVIGAPGLRPRVDDEGEAELRATLSRALDEVVVGVVARGGRRELRVGRGSLAIDGGPDDPPLRLGPFAFAQAQAAQNAALVERVTALAEVRGRAALELFAGAGNFTRALARRAAEVTAIEADPEAAAALVRLSRDLAAKGAVLKARRGDVTTALVRMAEEGRGFERVVLDPPRVGLGLAGARALAQVARGRTVFVACDPAALARDLGPLVAAGHRVAAAIAFDMMPMTPEIELVVALDAPRAGAG